MANSSHYLSWLTRIALGLVLALAIARATTMEYVREPFDVSPGIEAAPRGAGASTALWLDLLCALPALLVSVRAWLDRSFTLRRSLAGWIALPMGGWIIAGALRGDDRFAAAVTASHLCAALALLWATQQLVRNWRTVRLVGAIAVGLLLIALAHATIDRHVEMPQRQAIARNNVEQILQSMNLQPGSFEAQRLSQKLTRGELLGLGASINTFAAVLVVLLLVTLGLVVHRIVHRDEPISYVPLLLVLAMAGVVIGWTDSRAAYVTPVLGGLLLLLLAVAGRQMAQRRRVVLLVVVLGFVGVSAFLIQHGVRHGTLFHDSLNFRWRYWLGAMGVWQQAPIAGVGLESFQFHYLAHRLPIAAEEPKDPHNFLVRAACELGAVGLMLALAWVGRVLWEMSFAPRTTEGEPAPSVERRDFSDLAKIALICLAGVGLSLLISLDFAQIGPSAAIDTLKRLLYLCLLTLGAVAAAFVSTTDQRIDDRPAPWLRYAMLAGAAMFLVHNLIDFSMFESTAMFLLAVIAGAVLGTSPGSAAAGRTAMHAARIAFILLAMLAAMIVWVLPTTIAESLAFEGDTLLRSGRAGEAARKYQEAFAQWPGNADYAFRAARAMAYDTRNDRRAALPLMTAAVDSSPANPKYRLMRAQLALSLRPPDVEPAVRDYAAALTLDPANVARRLEWADLLAQLNRRDEAIHQYRLALWYEEQLSPDEPKRMPKEKVEQLHQKLTALGG